MEQKIQGNWATLIIPYSANGNIDYQRLGAEIDVLITSKPNGIYSNGTASEFFSQTEEEFTKINSILAEKCQASGTAFQIGASHVSPQISIDRIRRSVEFHPTAIQVILPDWYPPTIEESITCLKGMADASGETPLILYNPPHAKVVLKPEEWKSIRSSVPSVVGVKVSDKNRDVGWYKEVRSHAKNLSVFIPGHNLATGILLGAQGAYSNMSCLNPFAAQAWYELIMSDEEKGLELEARIHIFMKNCIIPLITEKQYSGFACDRFMAMVGGWADVGAEVRWPYRSIPVELVQPTRQKVEEIIPEFAF